MILWIRIKAYNKKPLNEYIDKIALMFRFGGNFTVRGPTYLPTRIVKFTVNKSPHIDKKSRDQLEIRVHTRVIVVTGTYRYVMPKFLSIDLPEGVFVEMTPILANPMDARYRSGRGR
ncbi:30S ribosomal protein S10 [Candidatus Hodgkinia cicadicola]|nr:30S ribosomal protein S10 [Candidatus Hodgkinia cicadicola]